MANKEIVLNFKAKVNTDVGDIKKILASLEAQMGELTIPEANFKTFKSTLEKINKELLNFEALTEKGSDNLADTKKIEKSWGKVTDLLFNVQSQLKNMGSEVDIFPKSVLTNIDKATTLLGKYNEKLKAVRESEAYTAKVAEISDKKERSKQLKRSVQEAQNKAQRKKATAIAKEQSWREHESEYNEKINEREKKIAEKEREKETLDQLKKEREESGLFTSQNKVSKLKTSQRVEKAKKVIQGDEKKGIQGTESTFTKAQEEFQTAKRQASAAKGQVTKYQKKSQKNEAQLKKDQDYLQLVDNYNKKLEKQGELYDSLVIAENKHKQALEELSIAEQETSKASRIENSIEDSQNKITNLDKDIKEIDEYIDRLKRLQKASTDTKREFTEANSELETATSDYNKCEQAVESLSSELKQMEVDQTSEEWQELAKAIKEITGIDLSDFAGDVGEAVKALEKYKLDEIEKTPSVAKQAETAFEGMAPAIKNVTNAADNLNRELTETERRAQEIAQVKGNIMDFFSISNTIDIFKDSVRNAFDTVKELDAVMTEMAVVTDYSIEDMWGKLPEYSRMASELGVATKEFYQAITLYFQQGLSEEQSVGLAIETLKMGRIAGMEGAEATEAMTAALRGFNMEINQINAQRVNDVYSKLAAITASDTNQIATAISKTASIASSANMDLETTAAFLAQIIETTQEAPETAGTALKTIIARFSEVKELQNSGQMIGTDEEGEEIDVNKIEKALKTVGISMDKFFAGEEGLDKIFLELSKKWKSLDFETQHYIATIAAGSRQQSRFIAMMSDYDRTIELVGAAYDSTGASQEQFDETMESLSSKLNQLHNAWTTFTMGLANSEIIKGVIDFLTKVLNTINEITEALSGSNGLIRSVFNALTLLAGLSLGKRVLTGTGGFIGSILTGGAAGGILGSKMSTSKTMSWLLGASLGGFISEKVSDLFSKDDEDDKDKKETTVINENDNSIDNSDNSINTTEVVNNYPSTETVAISESQNLPTFTKTEAGITNPQNQTLVADIPETSEATEATPVVIPETQSESKTEEDTKKDEDKTDWGTIASGAIGLITTIASEMLFEAGGELISKKLSNKLGGKVAKKTKNKVEEKASFKTKDKVAAKDLSADKTKSNTVGDYLKELIGKDLLLADYEKSARKSGISHNIIADMLTEMNEFKEYYSTKMYSEYRQQGKPLPPLNLKYDLIFEEALKKQTKEGKEHFEKDLLNFSNLDLLFGGRIGSYTEALDKSPMLQKIGPTLQNLGNLSTIAGSIGKTVFSTLGSAAGFLAANAGTIAAIAIPAALAVGAAVVYKKAKEQSQVEQKKEKYEEIATTAQSEVQEESKLLDDLQKEKDFYDLLVQEADNLTKGTNEYDQAMASIENHTKYLLQKYPILARYAKELTPEESIFDDENWNKVVGDQQEKVDNAQEKADKAQNLVDKATFETFMKGFFIESGLVDKKEYENAAFKDNQEGIASGEVVTEHTDAIFKRITGYTKDWFSVILQGIADSGLIFSDGLIRGGDEWNSAVDALNATISQNNSTLGELGQDGEYVLSFLWVLFDTLGLEADTLVQAFRGAATDITNAGAAVAEDAGVQPVGPQYLIDTAVSRYRDSISTTTSTSAAQANAIAAAQAQQAVQQAARNSIDSNSGGADTVWENDFDRLYNLIEAIEEETHQQQRIESRYELMMRTFGATVDRILEINIQELTSLERQRQYQQELIKQRMADIKMLQIQNANLAGYASVQKNIHGDSVLRIDWDAIEQITDDSLGQAVNEYISQLQEWLDTIYEAEDALIDIENSVLDIKERGKEEYLDFENRVKDALESYYQEEIDQLSTINDTIEDTNSRLIDSIQKYIDDQRKKRQNERTEKDLEKKQRRLSYLRQDTSNANQTEILTLQEEITLEQEDYTDTLIDQRISELQEQNDLAQEQRQHQIEIAQAQLEHYVSTGEIWKEVEQLMKDGFDRENGILRGDRLMDILKQADNFDGLSHVAKMKWLNDLTNQAKLAQAWTLGSAWYQQEGNNILSQISGEIANLDVGTTVNNYYTTGSGSSSGGYGNSGYSGSGGGSGISGAYGNGSVNIGSGMHEQDNRKYHIEIPSMGFYTGGNFSSTWYDKVMEMARNDIDNQYKRLTLGERTHWNLAYQALIGNLNQGVYYLGRYKTGGLADFTGPAWLDGTKAKPEYVLNSVQTKGFLTLVDVLDSIKNHSSTPKSENAVGNTYDIDINIETVKEEADIDKIAEKVQKSIVIASQYRSNTIIKR